MCSPNYCDSSPARLVEHGYAYYNYAKKSEVKRQSCGFRFTDDRPAAPHLFELFRYFVGHGPADVVLRTPVFLYSSFVNEERPSLLGSHHARVVRNDK